MKERPILFSTLMVRAILDGQKTQTRRAVKPQPKMVTEDRKIALWDGAPEALLHQLERIGKGCPYGKPGDRLWVKETWQYYDWNEEGEPCIRYAADNATGWPIPSPKDWAERLVDVWEELSRDENYKIDGRARDRKWRPSIFMFRWASRILLEIASVRVERLHDITAADAAAEGCKVWPKLGTRRDYQSEVDDAERATRQAFQTLWEKRNGAEAWQANPWVWVITFKRVES